MYKLERQINQNIWEQEANGTKHVFVRDSLCYSHAEGRWVSPSTPVYCTIEADRTCNYCNIVVRIV